LPATPHYTLKFIDHISDCTAENWNSITGTDYPFLRHEFLHALEASGSVGGQSGWDPKHALLFENETLVAVMPLYVKHHSYGEYVFDWSWADAYQRNGLPYYPKLVTAIPFTPATGPRLATKGISIEAAALHFRQGIDQLLHQQNYSGWHLLFPNEEQKQAIENSALLERTAVQYHWFNDGYESFDDFLATFKSRQRKNLRKERERVFDQGVSIDMLTGDALTPEIWAKFFHFYQITYAKRSGHGGYLTADFFRRIGETLSSQTVMMMAYQNGEAVAAALNFRSRDTLYGRYWGASRDISGLHFEACYYQGIEYCISEGIQRFDPGAQGEHKIQRGFTPTTTYSLHSIQHPGFREAIARFLEEESNHLSHYTEDAKQRLPFRHEEKH
jgi:predicted N-acyltransferase